MRLRLSTLAACCNALVRRPGAGPHLAQGHRAIVKAKCATCHGASAPIYEEWNLDRKNYESKQVGPRMDNYVDFMRHVLWPATGSMMRRLDDGKNAAASPATCTPSSARTTTSVRATSTPSSPGWVTVPGT